jgi:hypothetical protein
VNDWLLALLEQPGVVKKEMEPAANQRTYLPGEKEQIIAQLKSMGTSIGDELAARMEAE